MVIHLQDNLASAIAKIYFSLFAKLIGLFVFTRRDKWIFGSEMGYAYSSNSKYLFDYIRKNEAQIRAIWVSKSKAVVKQVRAEGGEAYFNFSHIGVFHSVSAGVYCCSTDPSDIIFVRMRSCKIINLWHSVTIKKVVFDKWPEKLRSSLWMRIFNWLIGNPRFNNVDLHIATSESQVKVLSTAFNSTNFAICGQPREDILFGKSASIATRIKEELGIGSRKLVLYMPTHRDYGRGDICPTLFKDNTPAKKRLDECFAVVYTKNHINMISKVEPYIDPSGTIREITNIPVDTQELLCAADVLITDYSSCYIEYLHLDRPIIFYHYDKYTEEDNEIYYNEIDIMPGPFVKTEEDLLNKIIMCLNDPLLYAEQRKSVKSFFYKHQGGDACMRVFDAINAIANY